MLFRFVLPGQEMPAGMPLLKPTIMLCASYLLTSGWDDPIAILKPLIALNDRKNPGRTGIEILFQKNA